MNGIKLFRVFGITVFLHWSWIVVAVYEIQSRQHEYNSLAWNIAEYLLLFLIVLLHEFGHALACRSVGGQAERIMLWPLGGVAYVSPPPRPGAVLWSIAAGPLVNVVLLLISLPLLTLPMQGDLHRLVHTVAYINIGLLIFNLLPVYPLDGGQILQSLLWFVMGRGKSMAVATVIGMLGSAGLGLLAFYLQSIWLGVMAFFVANRCWAGWKAGTAIREREAAERRPGFACPSCGNAPLMGRFWRCVNCKTSFDTFETGAICPSCGSSYGVTMCGDCRAMSPIAQWQKPGDYASHSPLTPPPVPFTGRAATDIEL
jgi:Zn-dependent protease/predicted RNA-binding Zn-ribbon protein involved in translation (DUF1610 family)